MVDLGDLAHRSVKIEAPYYSGSLDPRVYFNWEADMDYYLEWHEMFKEQKIWFA